jgi:DNA-binding SARP family transcriptional activator
MMSYDRSTRAPVHTPIMRYMMTGDARPTVARVSPPLRLVDEALMTPRLTLLGSAALVTTGGLVTGRAVQRHRLALLALLASTTRVHRGRDQLIAFLWPEADSERGRRLLSDSIYRINQALGGCAIVAAGDELRLERSCIGSDVADLEAAVGAGSWQDAAALYAGPFLDGFFLPGAPEFDHWMDGERARLARMASRALESLATDAQRAGRMIECVEWWERLALLAPDDSRVAVALTRALVATGQRGAAIRCVRRHMTYLREMLGIEPDPSIERLARDIATLAPGA